MDCHTSNSTNIINSFNDNFNIHRPLRRIHELYCTTHFKPFKQLKVMAKHQLIMKSILWTIYACGMEKEIFMTADHNIKPQDEIEFIELDLLGVHETGRKLLTRVEQIEKTVLIDDDLIIDKVIITTICTTRTNDDNKTPINPRS